MKQNQPVNTAKQPSQLLLALVSIGLLLIMGATVMPLFQFNGDTFRYIYAAGAALVLIGRLFTPYKGSNFRVKRLCRIEFWSALFFAVAVFFLFYPNAGRTDWLAFTLAGGIIQIYTSIMIPRTLAKAQKEADNNEQKG